MVDSSAIGVWTVLIPANDEGQMHVFSFISRKNVESDQKLDILYRK